MQGFTALLVRLSSIATCSNNCLIPQDIVVLILSANKRTNVKILNGIQLTANPNTIAMENFSSESERSSSVRLVLSGTFKKIARQNKHQNEGNIKKCNKKCHKVFCHRRGIV